MVEAKWMGHDESATIRLVLQEILEEQKAMHEEQTILLNTIEQLSKTTNKVGENLELIMKLKPVGPDENILKAIRELKLFVAGLPRRTVIKNQYALFPGIDSNALGKTIFGRWLLWIAICLFGLYLFEWSVRWLDNRKEVELKELQNNRIVNAWIYLYQQKNKELHRRMDSALVKMDNSLK